MVNLDLPYLHEKVLLDNGVTGASQYTAADSPVIELWAAYVYKVELFILSVELYVYKVELCIFSVALYICKVEHRDYTNLAWDKFHSDIRRFEMRAEIIKWGKCLGLRIPKPIAKEVGMVEGSVVDMSIDNGNLVVKVTKQVDVVLGKLLNEITDKNIHGKTDTGDALGGEIW